MAIGCILISGNNNSVNNLNKIEFIKKLGMSYFE